MISQEHSLHSSATHDKLLGSVQALRPYFHESIIRSGCEIFQHNNGEYGQHHAYIQRHEQCGDEQDSRIQSQGLAGDFRIEEHGMSHAQLQTQILEQNLERNPLQYDGHPKYGDAAHGGFIDELQNSGSVHQYGILGHNYIVSAHNGDIRIHDEGRGHDGYEPSNYIHHCYQVYGHDGYWPNGYIPDDYHNDSNINDQVYGQIQHGHEDQYRSVSIPSASSLAHTPVSITDNVPDILLLYDSPSLTPMRFCSHDDLRLPCTEEALEMPLPLHSPYLFTQHDAHQYQPQQDHEMPPALTDDVAQLDAEARRFALHRDNAGLTPITPMLSSPCNKEKVSSTACAKVSCLPQLHRQKTKMTELTRSENSSDESDALEDEGGHCNPNFKSIGISSNLVSERRRRKKINEALYTLRSVVPIVSKMDKASIVSDALAYAKQLQKQVHDMQNDILSSRVANFEVARVDSENVQEESSDVGISCKRMDMEKYCQSLPKHKILELTVSCIERNTYSLQMRCKKGRGDLLQLARAVEALDLDMLNTSVSSVGDLSIINTVVVKVDATKELKPEELKEMMLEVGSKYGLHV